MLSMKRPMVGVVVVGLIIVWTAADGLRAATESRPQPRVSTATGISSSDARVLLDTYCVTCHNERLQTGGLMLDTIDLQPVSEHAEVWEKVVRKLRGGIMPPAGMPRPDAPTQAAFVSWLETALDDAAAATPNPGRTETLHRLNRAEYHNAIRDLLTVETDARELLPADDGSYGFDNMAGALRVSQSLMERYLAAARKIAAVAVGSPPAGPMSQVFRVSIEQPQYEHVDGLPFGTRSGTLIRYNFPQDGEYGIRVQLKCPNMKDLFCDGSLGFIERHELEIAVDGERVHLFTFTPELVGSGERFYELVAAGAQDGHEVRVPITGGPHDVTVAFLAKPTIESQQARKRFEKPFYYKAEAVAIYQPFLEAVTITGPFSATGIGETPSRRRIFTCHPATPDAEGPCATQILSTLARRAYRRPVTDADVSGLLTVYDEGWKDGGEFEAGIEMALAALLVSPEFLFRVERDPVPVAPGTVYRVSDLELASRLSFFLWSSIPDEELLALAEQGTLHDPSTLERQVRRMVRDRRSEALTRNVAGQWLQLRNLEALRPHEPLFPDFDETLRQAFRRETELVFDSLVREDRSVLDLLMADYTFVNERLARHYGIPNVRGDDFRRVAVTDENRRGLLGHGSILTLTSHPTRTSPVLRGKWVLQNILGTPPPEPPPNVPALPEDEITMKTVRTVRERIAQHRANPVCASCHAMIDPIGFALEHFDAVGAWRERDNAHAIDASGALPDGTSVNGAASLRAALVGRPERFVTTVTEKLLTYALGRGLEHYDAPAVRRIVRDAARNEYRFSSVILGVVNSLPFQMRRSQVPEPTAASAAQ